MNTHTSIFKMTHFLGLCLATTLLTSATPAAGTSVLTGQSYGSGASLPQAPVSQTYNVELNKTEIVRLPVPASAILVGNPDIADISIHSSNTIFVIGRSYGETNVIVLDTQGRTILDADIQVSSQVPRNGVRVFFGGTERESYHCSPYCSAAPVLGDTPEFIGANSSVLSLS